MPSKDPESRYYWDACVFLAFAKNEAGRSRDIEALLDDAETGRIQIMTSMISITEVANGVRQAAGKRDYVIEQKIDDLWRPPSPIVLVDVYRSVAEGARDLMRLAVDRPGKLTPIDAIHLASARSLGVDRLHTYDERLGEWGPDIGIPVCEPPSPPPDLFNQGGE